jgi:hypothetical protein
MWGRVPKGKKKSHPRPVNAAKRYACAMKQRSELANDLAFCRDRDCAGEPIRPIKQDPGGPFTGQPGTSGCPGSTTTCPDRSCCFGGDLCCPCQGAFICCVAVIGCTCCG